VNNSVRINRSLRIPLSELELTYSTSSGPGGQHANKAATRVDLHWNFTTSPSLGPLQRERILSALRNRIDSSGTLHLSSRKYRSQLRNREDVIERLGSMIASALRRRKKRVPTAPSKASRERRLEEKRLRSEIKRSRRAPQPD
jgi:ribosome-associated protein